MARGFVAIMALAAAAPACGFAAGGGRRVAPFARTAPRLAAGAAPPKAAATEVATLAASLAARVPDLLAFAGQTLVVKYGGHAMTDDALAESFYADVVLLRRLGVNIVIVHGGGPQISGMLKDLGVQSTFVDGRRVTDDKTMEVVEMVLGGLVNNKLVNAISRAGGKAVGCGPYCRLPSARAARRFLRPAFVHPLAVRCASSGAQLRVRPVERAACRVRWRSPL